jgi:hypothetical protein
MYIIKKIIHYNNKNNYFILLTYNNYKLFGYNNFEPLKDDIIKGDIIERHDKNNFSNNNNNELEYNINHVQILLPNTEFEQRIRLLKFLNKDSFNLFTQINYGDDFWINIYKLSLEIPDIDNFTLNDSILNLFNHIKNYIFSLLSPFKKILIDKYKIKLNSKQLFILFTHPKFGVNINSWCNNLMLLYNIKGFGHKTIMMIANGIKLNIETKTKLIIINILIK